MAWVGMNIPHGRLDQSDRDEYGKAAGSTAVEILYFRISTAVFTFILQKIFDKSIEGTGKIWFDIEVDRLENKINRAYERSFYAGNQKYKKIV